uniref:Uncharacterized protein n=1 Tax=Glossina brevipalpis TaxID=37001 RepID=A0A1A9X5K8_9MUSC
MKKRLLKSLFKRHIIGFCSKSLRTSLLQEYHSKQSHGQHYLNDVMFLIGIMETYFVFISYYDLRKYETISKALRILCPIFQTNVISELHCKSLNLEHNNRSY